MTARKRLIGEAICEASRYRSGIIPLPVRSGCVRELESQGFYKFADLSLIDGLKSKAIATGNVDNDVFADATRRITFLDGEDIYERGALSFQRDAAKLFNLLGMPLSIEEEHITKDRDYCATFGGVAFELWNFEEPDYLADGWFVTIDRMVLAGNFLLQSLGKAERLYYDFSGNDTSTVLITEPMFNILMTSQGIRPADLFERPDRSKW